MAVTKFEKSQIETATLREYVPKEMRALFDHLLNLAKHSHKSGYPKRAGQELAHARKLAKKPGAQDLSPAKYAVEFRSAAQAKSHPRDWSRLRETYTSKSNAEAHARRIQGSERGMQTRVVFV